MILFFISFHSLLAVLNCSSTWILLSVHSVGLVCWIFVVLKVFLSPLVMTEKLFWVYYSRSTIIVAFKDFKCIVRFSSDFESFHWEISINLKDFSLFVASVFSLVVFGTLYFFCVLGALTIMYSGDLLFLPYWLCVLCHSCIHNVCLLYLEKFFSVFLLKILSMLKT